MSVASSDVACEHTGHGWVIWWYEQCTCDSTSPCLVVCEYAMILLADCAGVPEAREGEYIKCTSIQKQSVRPRAMPVVMSLEEPC